MNKNRIEVIQGDITKSEVDAIVNPSAVEREVVRPKINFNVNDTVKINDGPFLGLTGQVSMVDPDTGKLKVEVSIFNRKVQVDVEYWQVSKATAEDIAEAK